MANKHVIAIDLGASSGRVLQVGFDGKGLHFDELHRFPNDPVTVSGTLHWDILRLWHEIQLGIGKRSADAVSVGIDTWAVDFGLLDSSGNLLANPVHYRDSRNDGAMNYVFERVPRRDVFERTGIQFLPFNTLYQLAAMLRDGSLLLDTADTLLMVPDLLHYWLCGAKTCEFTNATSTQFYNPVQGGYDADLLAQVGIPSHFLGQVVAPGTSIGRYEDLSVIVPATHDTGSAVVGVPTTEAGAAYLSSGTWSLLGVEVDDPVINDASYAANLTNEGGYNDTYRLLKNIMGLWLIEQSLVTWRAEGKTYTYEDCSTMAQSVDDPFRCMIDPDAAVFLPPGDMPTRVREFCQQTGQPAPETDAEVVATIYTSLALKYAYVIDLLESVSGTKVPRLHIIGGGSQNELLCQMTANATGLEVYAGPVEATALGNAIVQLIALGELDDLAQARAMLSDSAVHATYTPQESWQGHVERFKTFVN